MNENKQTDEKNDVEILKIYCWLWGGGISVVETKCNIVTMLLVKKCDTIKFYGNSVQRLIKRPRNNKDLN